MSATPLLKVEGLKVSYGHIEAVKGIDFELHEGQITTLVGANGAGKSTTLLALSGLVRKAAGRVVLGGQDLSSLAPHKIVASGMVQVAEGRATLTTLTVRENLELGGYTRRDSRGQRAADLDHVYALFPRLKERSDGLAGNLSGGEQQMLAIGRALMAKPRVLLLDEPSEGLAPLIVAEVAQAIKTLKADRLSIVRVEQTFTLALEVADDVVVLNTGQVVHAGSADAVRAAPELATRHLGVF